MNKVAQYLQEHLIGEVITSPDAREHFSTDASIFKITPQIIIYPRIENDIRKAARFTWQLAERGRTIPITARGSGTDQSGAAIGSGIMMVFPAHMNKLLALDSGKGLITIQPGIKFGKLQQTLQTHGLFLPPYPSSFEYSSLGGAIANNVAGEKSVKYGVIKDYVRELRLVLANGEVIVTKRVNKRELNQKMGLPTFEGEIYRSIDALINDNKDLIESSRPKTSKNNSGYDIWNTKDKDGGLDLTSLIVGAQGTLGIISEATLETEAYNPKTSLLLGLFDDIEAAGKAIVKVRELSPSSLEFINENLLNFIDTANPNQLKAILNKPFPKLLIFAEFDDATARVQKRRAKKARKIFDDFARETIIAQNDNDIDDLWKIRACSAFVAGHHMGLKKALPVIDDGIVPIDRFAEFINGIYKMLTENNMDPIVWGHAGNGNVHMMPYLDLAQIGDRQKIFKLSDAYSQLIASLGGSTSGEHNDGRIRAPFLGRIYSEEMVSLFNKIKQIFDPYNTMNPGVKIGVTQQDLQALIRQEYSLDHFYDYLPKT